jgi:hypothetical protein
LKFRFAALAVALTFVLAACGTTGDDDEGGDTTTTTEATTTESPETTESTESSTTTTEVEVDEDAQARAEAIDIDISDFPADWEASPHQESTEENLVTKCSEFDLDELSLGVYDTEDFSTGDLSSNDGQSIEISTRVFEDEGIATDIADFIASDEFIACANEEIQSSFGGEVTGEVRGVDFTGIGDQTEGFSGAITVTDTDGTEVDLQIAFVAIRTGDLITGVSATGVTQALDTDVLDDLGERIVELQADA